MEHTERMENSAVMETEEQTWTDEETAFDEMHAKDALQACLELKQDIRCKTEQVDDLRARLTQLSAVLGEVHGGGMDRDRMGDTMAIIVDLQNEILTDIRRQMKLEQKVRRRIERTPNARYRLLLQMRYLNGRRWGEIAEMLDCSKDNVMRLHRRAIDAMESVREVA